MSKIFASKSLKIPSRIDDEVEQQMIRFSVNIEDLKDEINQLKDSIKDLSNEPSDSIANIRAELETCHNNSSELYQQVINHYDDSIKNVKEYVVSQSNPKTDLKKIYTELIKINEITNKMNDIEDRMKTCNELCNKNTDMTNMRINYCDRRMNDFEQRFNQFEEVRNKNFAIELKYKTIEDKLENEKTKKIVKPTSSSSSLTLTRKTQPSIIKKK